LEDLIASERLKDKHYGIIHYNSPDERGIDVALLYQKRYFKPISHNKHPLLIYRDNGKRDYTRDQLLVSGLLDGELIHLIVNHWPSRSGGEARSRPFRMAAAKVNKGIIDSLQNIDPKAKIITMGDLNDDPTSPSVKEILNAQGKKSNVKEDVGLYNPMAEMHRRGLNTLAYRDGLNLFDQIIFSHPFLEKEYSSYRFFKAGIYNKRYLTNNKGQYKGYPFRSYNYNTYQGGYSDHFPVYIYLIKEKQ
ncbi:MAG: endonuclease/exonuclease/phosphatase family protein, partial [Flavobacteriaceae bacterium]|nr:endonuclease/exonuclease/phosphatase family protein [Flavobacteriaceae bacterium]